MLNNLIKKLNGHATDVDALMATSGELGRDLDAAKRDRAELQIRRHQMLLDDATDAALDKIEREIARVETKIEKLEAAEPDLVDRIAAARAAARQRRWAELRDAYATLAAEFLAAARITVGKHSALVEAMQQARSLGFEKEAHAMMPATPNLNGNALLSSELLDLFERALTPAAAIAAAHRAKSPESAGTNIWDKTDPGYDHPIAANLRTLVPRPAGDIQHGISLNDRPRIPIEALTAKRSADDLLVLEPGQARVMALHNGWSPRDDAPMCYAGQTIRMDASAARAACDRGLIEILEIYSEPQTAAAPDAASISGSGPT